MKTPRKHTNFNDSTIIQNESSIMPKLSYPLKPNTYAINPQISPFSHISHSSQLSQLSQMPQLSRLSKKFSAVMKANQCFLYNFAPF